MPEHTLTITRLSHAGTSGLLDLLRALEANGEARWFQPHPFTQEHLELLCAPDKRDLHYLLANESAVLGYGLLRGWDEGYPTPSLGIAVHPAQRHLGCGATLMRFLHCAARVRNAERVRLRVHEDNLAAIAMYRRFGYQFEPRHERTTCDPLLVASKELTT